jgi:hypothetical protein
MQGNGGIKGLKNTASLSYTSGVWDTFDNFNSSDWPLVETYEVSVSGTTALVGSDLVFTIDLVGVLESTLYYTISFVSGSSSSGIFSDNLLSNSISVSNPTSQILLSKSIVVQDNSEDKVVQLQLRKDSVSGPIVATSEDVTIPRATFAIDPVPTSINEGDTISAKLTVNNVKNSTALFVTVDATTDEFLTTGIGVSTLWETSNPTIQFFTAREDARTEGSENFTLRLRRDSVSGTTLAISPVFTVNDTSTLVSVTPNVTNVDEGGTVTFTITTTDFSGTLSYELSYTGGVSQGDFVSSPTGNVTVSSNSATVDITVKEDAKVDGAGTFALVVKNPNAGNAIVGTSAAVTVNDTSYVSSITASSTAVNEGETVTITVNTVGTSSDLTLYYQARLISGTALRQEDFTDGLLSGSFLLQSNVGTFQKTFALDLVTEGPEEIVFDIYNDAVDGTLIGTSPTITVSDTSTGTPEPTGAAIVSGIEAPTYGNTSTGVTQSGWTAVITNTQDDANTLIPLGFNMTIYGATYSGVYVGSNDYVTWGSGQNAYNNYNFTTWGVPKLLHNMTSDNSWQYLQYKQFTGYTRIRFEGNASTSGTVGSGNIVWEMTIVSPEFSASGKTLIEVRTGINGRGTARTQGIGNSDGTVVTSHASQQYDSVVYEAVDASASDWTAYLSYHLEGIDYA